MEGDTKRLRLTLNDDGEPVVTDYTGAIISGEQIGISNSIGNQVLKLLMQRGDFGDNPAAILSKLEKLHNRAWYQFVVRFRLWEAAFAQKFPEQYKYAIDKPQWWEQVKVKLDKLSQKPGRQFTYWKRWYEYLTKTKSRFKGDYRGQVKLLFEKLEDDDNPLTRHVWIMVQFKYFHHIDRYRNIILCYRMVTNPKKMISVNFDTRDQKVIPYDKSILGEEILYKERSEPNVHENHIKWTSLDGFFITFYLEAWKFIVMK